jgi:N-acetylmuramoyl-L-alanine amidase
MEPGRRRLAQHEAGDDRRRRGVGREHERVGPRVDRVLRSGTEPLTDAQFEAVAHLVAAASKALAIPVSRSTVVVHADINSVSRRSDPWPPATREARVKRVIARANAILRPPTVSPQRPLAAGHPRGPRQARHLPGQRDPAAADRDGHREGG